MQKRAICSFENRTFYISRLLKFFILVVLCGSYPVNLLTEHRPLYIDPLVIEEEVEKSGKTGGYINVYNQSKRSVAVVVEPEQWIDFSDTNTDGDAKGNAKSWVKAKPKSFILGPGKKKKVKYFVKAPKGAKGASLAMIFFRKEKAGVYSSGDSNVALRTRTGVALYTKIKGTEINNAEISKVQLSNDEVFLTVENKGNIFIRPRGKIFIKDKDSKLIGVLDIPYTDPIYPGGSKVISVKADRLDKERGQATFSEKKLPVPISSLSTFTIEAVINYGEGNDKKLARRKIGTVPIFQEK